MVSKEILLTIMGKRIENEKNEYICITFSS